jgi:NTP pyrophosphatase (non-canonical NTP hydrolase)
MENYIEKVLRTESKDIPLVQDRFCNNTVSRLTHAALGMNTEAGEFLDVIKKYLFYGKDIDYVNLREELGDLCWYIGLACDVLETNFDNIQQQNIAKLESRYPEKFTVENAINRDLNKEREVLEK